ncbi:P-loop containing nucleoside triphosphate hydrolase protein [Truncatella angustata]|uniref:P-loop containing nucleoside triphosphate hydrolase protein n=1 Tax=Truncatella angustata TaxID=152316 RepID=A0A9P8URP1_9PEZI|nr:P-loop containing nucleoside triphosphate hydrolase protein [Truncatella angustata]KAH6656971.1 P-loop containing nucleoside triphosphate hydrolase protein [Truncatella angustata]
MQKGSARSSRPSMASSSTSARTGVPGRPGVRQTTTRTSSLRPPIHHAVMAARIDRMAAPSPAESLLSAAATGTKRKEREFEMEAILETNINVVVRCRGRNEREVKENSAVVVETEGAKGKLVELSMGPNAVTNKTYNFDRVFSPASDQNMIYEDVVKPILDDMLNGMNCTIFAYGQTGTGKTYTMSGDMNDTFGILSDNAGIIPRVLHFLFKKLDSEGIESSVKCSFIELYNEELRDLISKEENTKLKIFDDTSRKGHTSTVVQGIEETYIQTAAQGVRLLQGGSLKRQVAATKCNDLSSRSHTVFTITTCVKKTGEDGEDYISTGKLNLVDLAGSENIQRSGAENKRAAEAGLINKSLLTLGRVINALVDRSQHIPYRESKLTRLLQDSLGGRTKTCIIATISPARSNLEETISTLDYAFRAKNIRNKPQITAMINKKTLLKEFTYEIERLKSELIATRTRNGVYLSNDSYEEMTVESESRRIQTEEQAAKIETLESNLRNKVQELFSLTSNFMGLKDDHEQTRTQLDDTKGVLEQTELVLGATRKTLAEEAHIRKAHEKTEQEMHAIGDKLISKLQETVGHVGGLRAKNKRKSDLQSLNRGTWEMSQDQVSDVTALVESRVEEFQHEQQKHISSISQRMQSFVQGELQKLSSTQSFLDSNLEHFVQSRESVISQSEKSKQEMDEVLEEIKEVRDNIKESVGESLQAIATAAEKIAQDVLSELSMFHNQLHTSYSSLGKDFKSVFETLFHHITSQRTESDGLREQLKSASETIVQSNASISAKLQEVVEEERRQAAEERKNLLLQIAGLINSQAELQESRLANKAASIQKSMQEMNTSFEGSITSYSQGMDVWGDKEEQLLDDVSKSRETLKTKLQDDWNTADKHSTSIQETTKSVHAETVRVVDEQMKDLDEQMTSLDDFVTRARSQNATHHEQHAGTFGQLSETVENSYSGMNAHFKETFSRVKHLEGEMDTATGTASEALEPLSENLCRPLSQLRDDISATKLQEYQPTGSTPQKVSYEYPTHLPQTKSHSALINELHGGSSPSKSSANGGVFADADPELSENRSPSRPPSSESQSSHHPLSMSLREIHPNSSNGFRASVGPGPLVAVARDGDNSLPLFKKPKTTRSRIGKAGSAPPAHGRENIPISMQMLSEGADDNTGEIFAQGASRRKSPRLK